MRIVEVRFIKDSQNVQTGWEFYPVGSSAHFYANQADALVEQGRVVKTNDPPIAKPIPPAPNYDAMTVKELKVITKRRGMTIKSTARKAELITALEEKQNG